MPSHRPSSHPSGLSSLAVVAAVIFALVGLAALACVAGVVFALDRSHPQNHAPQLRTRTLPRPFLIYATGQVSDPGLNARFDPVIERCLDGFSAHVNSSHRLYMARIGRALPPVGNGPPLLPLLRVSEDPAECETALRSAAAMAPDDPAFGDAARRYAVELRAVVVALNDADPYYRQEDWRDDSMARGRLMHGVLIQRFEATARAHSALASYIERAQRDHPTTPCRGAAEGGSVRCDFARHHAVARRVTVAAVHATIAPDGTVAGLDLPRLAEDIEALEASMRVLLAIESGAVETTAERSEVRSYLQQAGEHLRHIKTLHRIARDRTQVDAEQWNDVGPNPPGSPARIAWEFNRVVSIHNDEVHFTGSP